MTARLLISAGDCSFGGTSRSSRCGCWLSVGSAGDSHCESRIKEPQDRAGLLQALFTEARNCILQRLDAR